MVAVHTFQGTRWLLAGEVPEPGGNRHPLIAPYGAYECADGAINVAVGSETLWRRFAPLVDLDPGAARFAVNEQRVQHVDELEAHVNGLFRHETVEVWLQRLDAAGIPAGRVATLPEVYADPQLEHLGLVDAVDHPWIGAMRLPGSPLRYSRSGPRTATAPPVLGADTAATLARLGLEA